MDLISRQDAIKAVFATKDGQGKTRFANEAKKNIENLPSAEPKKGKWVNRTKHYIDDEQEFYYTEVNCSCCGVRAKIGWPDQNFCPNCGAEMEE